MLRALYAIRKIAVSFSISGQRKARFRAKHYTTITASDPIIHDCEQVILVQIHCENDHDQGDKNRQDDSALLSSLMPFATLNHHMQLFPSCGVFELRWLTNSLLRSI